MSKPEVKKTRSYRSLTVTLAIAFMALSATVLLIASGLDMYLNFQTHEEIISKQQQLIAKEAANTVKNFIQEKFSILETAVRLGDMAVPQQVEQKLILEKLLGLEPAFHQLVLLNEQKEEVHKSARISNLGFNQLSKWLEDDLFSLVERNERHIGSIYIDEVSSEPLVVMTVKVTDVFGDFKGVLVAEVNLKFMWDLVDNIKIGEEGLAYVVDRKGDLIAFGDISRVLKGENLVRLKEVSEFVNDTKLIRERKADIAKGIKDTYVMTTHVHLGVPDWAVVVELPVAEAYEPIIMGLRLMLCVMFLSLLLAVVAGIYLSKRITRPVKDLRDATRNISKGDLSTRIEVKSKDEIGQLAASFNHMVENLNETTVSRDSLAKEVAERKRAEAELRDAQEKLIETAHKAGMAEVATDVLHNVGNVLNSINVSASLITEKVTNSKLANLKKVANIINEHIENIGTFLVEDSKGKHIPVYLTEVCKLLTDEQADIVRRLQTLTENVEHVKHIVSMQQSYSKVSGLEVSVSIAELIEDSIQINSAGLERHGAKLKRDFADLPDVEIDKQKVLQILVNLINNAKYALSWSNAEEKLITIRLYKHNDSNFRIEVADSGIGISKENLTKIFNHGFTTKKDGHGFGLHSGALAAFEMGGSLTAHSDGEGRGAMFRLELPFKPVKTKN